MSNEGRGAAAPAPARAGADDKPAAPKPQPRLAFPPVELVSKDELESIHQAALKVLREIGMDILHAEAKALLKDAGADVDPSSDRVRFDPALVESKIGLAPQEFTLHARNPERNVEIGGRPHRRSARSPRRRIRSTARAAGVPAIIATSRISSGSGRRSTRCMSGAAIPSSRSTSTPRSAISTRCSIMLTLSDKPIHAYSLGRERILDGIEMARIARGIDDETLEREPSLFTVINSSSPLRLDTPMMEGVLQMARRNQVVVLTPFTLAGAMAPGDARRRAWRSSTPRRWRGSSSRRRRAPARRSSTAASPPTST